MQQPDLMGVGRVVTNSAVRRTASGVVLSPACSIAAKRTSHHDVLIFYGKQASPEPRSCRAFFPAPSPVAMSTTSYRTATAGSQWPPSYNSTTAAIGANTDRSIGQPPDFDPPTPPTSRPWSPPVPRSEISTQPWPFSDGGGTTIVDQTVKKRSSATKWFLAGIVVALLIIIAILGGVFGSRLATQNSSRYLFPTLFVLVPDAHPSE